MQTIKEICLELLTSQYAIVFCAPAARLCDDVEGLCAHGRTQTFHIIIKKARLRARSGLKATFEGT